MAEISGFHNSKNGDRRVKADFFARFFGSLIGNGVFPNPSTGLQVIANGDMTVTVKAGKAWINGMFYENTADMTLSLDVSDGVLKRIDRVVLQYSTMDRTIAAKVKKGTFASSPVASSLQRDADAYELGLADVLVNNGVVSITQLNITDLRLNTSLCGNVHGLIDQVDTETIFNQYLAWFNETKADAETDIANIKAEFESDFNTWFATLQGVLSGDVAGNLLNLINDNAADIATNVAAITALDGRLDTAETNIDGLDSRLDTQERLLTVTITTTWTGSSAPYTQTITATGVTANDEPIISPLYSATLATALLEKEAWNMISKIETGANSITVTCFDDKPTAAVSIQLKGA